MQLCTEKDDRSNSSFGWRGQNFWLLDPRSVCKNHKFGYPQSASLNWLVGGSRISGILNFRILLVGISNLVFLRQGFFSVRDFLNPLSKIQTLRSRNDARAHAILLLESLHYHNAQLREVIDILKLSSALPSDYIR